MKESFCTSIGYYFNGVSLVTCVACAICLLFISIIIYYVVKMRAEDRFDSMLSWDLRAMKDCRRTHKYCIRFLRSGGIRKKLAKILMEKSCMHTNIPDTWTLENYFCTFMAPKSWIFVQDHWMLTSISYGRPDYFVHVSQSRLSAERSKRSVKQIDQHNYLILEQMGRAHHFEVTSVEKRLHNWGSFSGKGFEFCAIQYKDMPEIARVISGKIFYLLHGDLILEISTWGIVSNENSYALALIEHSFRIKEEMDNRGILGEHEYILPELSQ